MDVKDFLLRLAGPAPNATVSVRLDRDMVVFQVTNFPSSNPKDYFMDIYENERGLLVVERRYGYIANYPNLEELFWAEF